MSYLKLLRHIVILAITTVLSFSVTFADPPKARLHLTPRRIKLANGNSFNLNLPETFDIAVAAQGLKRVRFMDGEPRYEGMPVGFYFKGTAGIDRFDDYDVRQAAYWSVIAGACGHTYGNNNVWQFFSPGAKRDTHAGDGVVRPDGALYGEPGGLIGANIPWNSAGGHTIVLSGGDTKSTEIYAFEGNALRQLTHQNDALIAELDLGATEEVEFKSKDGTDIHGLLTYPVGYVKGAKVPLLLRIHGGPNGQDQHGDHHRGL